MSEKTEILNVDVSVLFDIIELGILEDMFKLDYDYQTSEYIILEIKRDNQKQAIKNHIDNGALKVHNVNTFKKVFDLQDEFPGLSIPDCSLVELSEMNNGTLLCSDQKLCNVCSDNGVSSIGIFKIIEQLVNYSIIKRDHAIELLNEYPKINKWAAPMSEIEKEKTIYTCES